ncbi:MAG: polyhydroxyalkanoate depolymerase [Rickettsiales bacterium]|nr:MAG: polyhydroxyalkanoate depolymerase [Rickettsiales bacterium]
MHHFTPDTSYLYAAVESNRSQMSPARFGLMMAHQWLEHSNNPLSNTHFGSTLKASIDILERVTRKYSKPEFGIKECVVNGNEEKIRQTTISKDTFCNLLHFSKPNFQKKQPKLLIVAPMSGHHATLLRGTVRDTLPFFDVYITDWIDASQIPITDGSFDLDDFIDYIINYTKLLGPDLHILAVCQPTVPVLAATAIMSADKDLHVPKSMILIGGPIDGRKNPTKPNHLAMEKDLAWFDQALVTNVPPNYPGYRRRVYPGFLQLSSFMMMNMKKHVDSHVDLFKNLIIEDDEKTAKQKEFYDEYLSVMDLPAEFYLQTIKEVFHDFSLAKGKFVSRGRKVDLTAITKCALMGIEGEHDDIAAVGQTKAALKLCKNIPDKKKKYHLQKGVGHYGVFNGSKFRKMIVPEIKDFVYAND